MKLSTIPAKIRYCFIFTRSSLGKQEKNNQIYVYKNLIFNHVLFQWIQREFFDWLSDWEKEINKQDISEMEKSC